jgi:hypothetical protein
MTIKAGTISKTATDFQLTFRSASLILWRRYWQSNALQTFDSVFSRTVNVSKITSSRCLTQLAGEWNSPATDYPKVWIQ